MDGLGGVFQYKNFGVMSDETFLKEKKQNSQLQLGWPYVTFRFSNGS